MPGTSRPAGWGYFLGGRQVFGSSDPAGCGGFIAALNRPATASSTENAGTSASAAVDGDTGTRWSSAFSDPQWLQVDLGAATTVCQVVLYWESAYATAFQIQVSADAVSWTTVFAANTGAGGVQTLAVNGTGRYVRMFGSTRATGFGYSLWEFGVYGTGGGPSPDPVISQFQPVAASSWEGGDAPAAALDGRTSKPWRRLL